MRNITFFVIVVNIFFWSKLSFAQETFNTTIVFPANINKKELYILYDKGLGLQKNQNKIKNNKVKVSDGLKAKYATITIIDGANELNFWVSNKNSTIILKIQNNRLTPLKYINALNLDSLEEQTSKYFLRDESNSLNNFLVENKNWNSNDSLVKIFWSMKYRIDNKKLEFVKQNAHLYYSFSLFRRELIHSHINIDTLLNTYHQTFPDSFKLSTEGSEILKVLNGRNLKKNLKAPDFNLLDIKGKRVALQNLKDNYVLLTFWSTSCKPCLEEMPTILQLNNSYAQKKLTVVSVSTDTEREIFLKTIKKYQMNWINIYGNLGDIIKSYGVKSIPQIYLIDKSGKIIYSREEEEDFTPELLILRTTLKNIFLNT